jgi:hypothetical protein
MRVLPWLLAAVVYLSACTGSQGTQPTEQKIPVIMPKQEYEEPVPMDYALHGLPEFVDNLAQCTDTEKQYVLPNGYLYHYGQLFVPYATNQLHLATDENGELFLGCGYQDNVRLRSVLEIEETDYSFVTGFIPIRWGDVIYLSGDCFHTEYANANLLNTALYDAAQNPVVRTTMKEAAGSFFEILETNEDGYVTSMRVNGEQVPQNLAYIRLTLLGSGAQQVISVNQSLEEGEEVPSWVQSEKYISAAWCKEIAATAETVNNLALTNPDTAIRFLFATDIHLDPDPTVSYTTDLGKVCAEVMDRCGISFLATGGDNSAQSSEYMPTVFAQNMQDLLEQLAPISPKNILLSVGNHDGATGACEENGETVYYRYQLNNEQRSAVFFDWQRETNVNKKFDSDGTYYYLDDPASKTRYIILNSFWSQWEGEENGFVPDIEHSFFHSQMFGPQQLRWFAEKALDMPVDYGAVIITHYAPTAKDFEVFRGIVDAFSNHTSYRGSYAGQECWQSTEIAVNYKYADGEIIAVFQGHNHEDALGDFFQNVPCINVTTTGAFWAARGETALERVKGTASEFAVDVVVIDRESRMIYLTRLGSGEDRTIPY